MLFRSVMRAGRIEQVGAPQEIYGRPRTRYIASFIGETNFLPARRLNPTGWRYAMFEVPGGWRLAVPNDRAAGAAEQCTLAFRPHDIELSVSEGGPTGSCDATLVDVQFTGSVARYVLEIAPGITVQATQPCRAGTVLPTLGMRHRIAVNPDAIWVYPADGA